LSRKSGACHCGDNLEVTVAGMIKQLASKTVYQNPWMKVVEDTVEFENGHTGIYGVVKKDDFVLIIPFDGEKFYLVEQYRYPIQQYSLEFPQGKHEEKENESAEVVAQAELLEETGLTSAKFSQVGFLYDASGYSNQGFHIYLAEALEQHTQQLDRTEAGLVVKTLTQAELEEKIVLGKITDAPTISAYCLFKLQYSK
jgi:ADP-ribose pyrophosphatase